MTLKQKSIKIQLPTPPIDTDIEWLVAEWTTANEQRRLEIEDYLRLVIALKEQREN